MSARVNTDKDRIEEILTKGVERIYPSKEALKKLLMSGQRIRLYTGIDPTTDFIHIGHMIWMRKLSEFQKLGHEVIFLLGGFTAMIGDPDKKYTRVPLTKEQVVKNYKDYKKQASRILDFDNPENPIKIKNNYSWLSKIHLKEWLEIMSHATLQQFMGHEMFRLRWNENLPIRLHELSYPLLQAYDSVYMDVDLQIGGTDQTFNMLMSRALMKELKNKEQYIITLKLLTDPSGVKMGKTTKNAISFKDSASEVYSKVMAFPDSMIPLAFELCTNASMKEVNKIKRILTKPDTNPMEFKKELALRITTSMYGEKAARKAQTIFEKTFQKREFPPNAKRVFIKKNRINIVDLLTEIKAASSKSEAKRSILQGSVDIDGKTIKDKEAILNVKQGLKVKVGKYNFYFVTMRQ